MHSDVAGQPRTLRIALMWMVVISIGFPMIRTTNWFSNITTRDASYSEGSITLPLIFGSLYLLAGAIIWLYRSTLVPQLRHLNPFLVLLGLWAAASVLWSPYPMVTIKRAVQFAGFIAIGLAIAPALAGRDLLPRTIALTLTSLLAVSLFVIFLAPSVIGIDHALGGAWRGIFWHKNFLGMAAGFSLLLWVRELYTGSLNRHACLVACAFTFVMLVMSKSATAFIVCMVGIGVYLLLARRYFANAPVTLLVILSAVTAVLFGLLFFFAAVGRLPLWSEIMAPVALLFNKSVDLTGRTEIWQLVLLEAGRHPIIGIGLGAFWLGYGSPSQFIIDALYWVPLQAHNGYIDIFNELGLVGIVLMSGMLVVHAWHLFRLLYIDRELAAIHAALFAIILVTNITESQLFRGVLLQYAWLVYSSITVSTLVGSTRRATPPIQAAQTG